MKAILRYILPFCFILLWGCDNIDKDERLIEIEIPAAQKSVLIEEFSGQKCVNCPTAAAEAQAIQESYEAGKVVVVCIHAGFDALPTLSTADGETYNSHWGITTYPAGLVDRKGVSEYAQWSGLVRERIAMEAPVEIGSSCEYDTLGHTATLKLHLRGVQNIDGNLQVWLTQDSLVAPQRTPTGINRVYVHNHIFRAAVNGTWGSPITLQKGEERDTTLIIPFKNESWVPRHMHAITFVSNETAGVLQVNETTVSR